jgi:hypothetical protein
MNKKIYWLSIIAFLIYQVINFIYFPLHTIFPDESRFVSEAIKFANTNEFWIGNERAWEMPLTGIFYGLIYKIFDNYTFFLVAIRMIQSLLLILNAYLVYQISFLLFKNKQASFISFFITLFYPFFIYYQGLLLSETIFITILLLGFFYLYKWYETDFNINKYFLLTNFFLIFSIYSKATLTILPPILITFFVLLNKKNTIIITKIFFLSLLMWILFLTPWWLRNYTIFNIFVPFTTSSGMNLYLGNNSFNKDGGCDWSIDVNRNLVKNFKKLSEIEQNRKFKNEAIKFILENPKQFLNLIWLKFKRFYNIQFNNKKYRNSYLNIVSILSFGIILLFFIISIILLYKQWRKLSPIYILIIYFTILHSIIISSLRYRLPIEPFMIILASYGIYYLLQKFKKVKN